MREIIRGYLSKISHLGKISMDEDGNFINGYDSKIFDILTDYSQKIFNDVKAHTVYKPSQYEDLFINLDILYYLLDEEGYALANTFIINITDNKWRTEAKVRLFMMFVKRLYEINYLLKGGYASAALSITRGIYEIGVYLEIILSNDENIAEKFLKHSNNDRLNIAKSLSDNQLKSEIIEQINELQFGEAFLYEYGWAKSLISNRITFKKLAQITELSTLYYMYKYCCLSVHANISDSLNGVGINKVDKGKSIWLTTSSEEGIETVFNILMSFSYSIIQSYLGKGNLNSTFIMFFIKSILNNKRRVISLVEQSSLTT